MSMSGWGGVSGLLSRIWLFDANGSILVFVDDISLVFRTFSGGGRVIIGIFVWLQVFCNIGKNRRVAS